MNLRSVKAVFFILIFLTSKIGMALNVHYCGGHIEEIALAWNAHGCKMSMEKSHDHHQHNKKCERKYFGNLTSSPSSKGQE